jgi:uncharacterized tellurite resistance protein B-like protein
MSFLDWLGKARRAEPAAGDTETVRKIVAALESLPQERARFVAAFAYVMSRVAGADLEVSPDETAAMERLVRERAGFSEAESVLVVGMAKNQHRLFGGSENFVVTREFAAIASREEKLALVDALFAVSAADRSIVVREETEIRNIASELGLDHGDYVAVKSRYRDHLSVLRREDGR